MRKISSLKKEVADAKSEYQEVKSDINFRSTESELAKRLEDAGLKRQKVTPIVIASKD